MASIQATTIGGSIIEKARWEVPNLDSVQTGHMLAVCLNSDDKSLLASIKKHNKTECSLDQSEDGRNVIMATFLVKQIRHMIDGANFDTMCIVVPTSRYVEQVTLYLLDPSKCDKRFVGTVRHG